jgi:hypothetical protein
VENLLLSLSNTRRTGRLKNCPSTPRKRPRNGTTALQPVEENDITAVLHDGMISSAVLKIYKPCCDNIFPYRNYMFSVKKRKKEKELTCKV